MSVKDDVCSEQCKSRWFYSLVSAALNQALKASLNDVKVGNFLYFYFFYLKSFKMVVRPPVLVYYSPKNAFPFYEGPI